MFCVLGPVITILLCQDSVILSRYARLRMEVLNESIFRDRYFSEVTPTL